MATASTSAASPTYVFQLSFSAKSALAAVLDPSAEWEKLAGRMHFTQEEVMQLRRAAKSGDSPTCELLRVWGTEGYTASQLFTLCRSMGNVRAMKLLLPFVDEKCRQQFDQKVLDGALKRSAAPPTVAAGIPTACEAVEAKPKVASDLAASLQSTISIPFHELQLATNDFSPANIVGRGGYGIVYQGYWKHTPVAVKRLMPTDANATPSGSERVRQSLSELQSLSVYRHDNILPLYGYSLDGGESCLVYQFMRGGSLEDRIRKTELPVLSWLQKLDIVIGAARGVNFLHTCGREPLIHGDIKSANILLDEHLQPKLGDFGMARKGAVEIHGSAPPLIASHIKGTLAYLPPEFVRSKHLSSKLDVFSFGVVMYEVASGLRAHSENRRPENLVEYVRANSGSLSEQQTHLVDRRCPCLVEADWNVFRRLLGVGTVCTQLESSMRPTMDEVLAVLLDPNYT